MKNRARWALGGLFAASLGVTPIGGARAQQGPVAQPARPPGSEPRVDPRADQILRRMSGFMGSLRAFSFTADNELEVVTKDGQKIDFSSVSDVKVERPNRFRSDRRGEVANLSFFYDGKTLALLGRGANLYATAAAPPPTLDATIDFARDVLDLDAPAADLLNSDPYRVLMEDVVSGQYVGTAQVNGRTCHHLAYKGNETDWQLWVEDGSAPVPCRFVITSKTVQGAPEYRVEIRNFRIEDSIPDEVFRFEPPAGARKIDFLGLSRRGTGQQGKGR